MKAINVNISSAKLHINKVQAQNEALQNKICSQIDNSINKDKTIDFKTARNFARSEQRKQNVRIRKANRMKVQ